MQPRDDGGRDSGRHDAFLVLPGYDLPAIEQEVARLLESANNLFSLQKAVQTISHPYAQAFILKAYDLKDYGRAHRPVLLGKRWTARWLYGPLPVGHSRVEYRFKIAFSCEGASIDLGSATVTIADCAARRFPSRLRLNFSDNSTLASVQFDIPIKKSYIGLLVAGHGSSLVHFVEAFFGVGRNPHDHYYTRLWLDFRLTGQPQLGLHGILDRKGGEYFLRSHVRSTFAYEPAANDFERRFGGALNAARLRDEPWLGSPRQTLASREFCRLLQATLQLIPTQEITYAPEDGEA